MSIRRLILITIILVLTFTSVSYASYQFQLCGVSVIRTTTSKEGPVLLSICLKHTSELFLKNVQIYVYVFNGSTITPLPITYTLVYPYQELRFNVLVNTTVEKWHLVNIRVWWEKELVAKRTISGLVPGGPYSLIPSSQELNATIYFPGEPELDVRIVPTVLSPSSTYVMDVKICNVGSGPMYNVKISMNFIPTSAYIIVENTRNLTLSIRELSAGECIIDKLKITSGPSLGLVQLKIYTTYVDSIGNIGQLVMTYPLEITYSGVVQIVPEKLYLVAGRKNNAILDICNRYGSAIENAKLIIKSIQGGILMNSTVIYVGNVSAHECRPIKLVIIIPKTSEMIRGVSLTYELMYKIPPDILVSKYGTVGWSVIAQPRLVITQVTTAPKHPMVGESIIISIIVENLGEAPAYNVNITAIPGPGLSPVSSTYNFYPKLDSYSQLPASFTLNVTKSGTLTCTIVVKYVDPYGVTHIVRRIITIRATSLTGAGLLSSLSYSSSISSRYGNSIMSTIPYIIVAVVAIIVIVSIVVACRRRRGRS
ncbi:MAG: hypothetical protein GXO26_09445 [Crenarchaeota archaeon]|nr:hypothetical protein [Thermoproteota archaeon]